MADGMYLLSHGDFLCASTVNRYNVFPLVQCIVMINMSVASCSLFTSTRPLCKPDCCPSPRRRPGIINEAHSDLPGALEAPAPRSPGQSRTCYRRICDISDSYTWVRNLIRIHSQVRSICVGWAAVNNKRNQQALNELKRHGPWARRFRTCE